MTKYSQNYISTHDIDWFAKVTLPNGQIIPIHIASRGTELPDVVNNKEQNRRIQTKVAKKIELPLESKLYDDVVYVDYANHNEISNEDKIYLQTFGDMAHLGFYSFDTIMMEDSLTYILVAYPNSPLASNIMDTLPNIPLNQLFNILDQLIRYGIL